MNYSSDEVVGKRDKLNYICKNRKEKKEKKTNDAKKVGVTNYKKMKIMLKFVKRRQNKT